MLKTKLISLVFKLARTPRTILFLFCDRLLTPIWLKLSGVQIGRGCNFVGFPIITRAVGAQITLGNRVAVYSRTNSNPPGLPHRTILAALSQQSQIRIGDNTGISGVSIVAQSSITIGQHVLIGAGACLWDTDFHPVDPNKRFLDQTRDARSAPIKIDDEVFIGARVIILKGVHIGFRAVIGAGAVVTGDVRPGDMVAGNPARSIGTVKQQKGIAK